MNHRSLEPNHAKISGIRVQSWRFMPASRHRTPRFPPTRSDSRPKLSEGIGRGRVCVEKYSADSAFFCPFTGIALRRADSVPPLVASSSQDSRKRGMNRAQTSRSELASKRSASRNHTKFARFGGPLPHQETRPLYREASHIVFSHENRRICCREAAANSCPYIECDMECDFAAFGTYITAT